MGVGVLRFLSSFLNKRKLPKLLCLLGLALTAIYFIMGIIIPHTSDKFDSVAAADDELLRKEPPAIMVERRMLNANEDNLESLRAPTTAKANRLNSNMLQRGMGVGEGQSGAAPAPAQSEKNADDRNFAWNRADGNRKSNNDIPRERRLVRHDTRGINSNGNTDRFGDNRGIGDSGKDNDVRVKEKPKQWETYDYENPNNLLQIHVDRAPEHTEGAGQPWPMPQLYITELVTYVVDVDHFRIHKPSVSCARVNRAVDRYTYHINSKMDLFIPDGAALRKVDSRIHALRELRLSLSRPCGDSDLPHEHMSEQYKLTINDAGAELSAQEPWGIIRGLETFSQIIYFQRQQGFAVVNGTTIKDYPRFRFRGLMVDTARHYIPVKHLKRTMDAMSYNKLNVFHWHMVDDQSFPFVSKVFPKLSKMGAYSAAQIYTQADILHLINYAGDRAIRIVPEFDSPGHTRSWGLGYPKLLTNCSAEHYPFGAVNPVSNYTYEFMSRFWAEIHNLFPDSTVHVGGDEINYKCWLRVKKLREFMIQNNMTGEQYDYLTLDGDKLQGYYLKHLLEVMPRDRKKIAWEEAFNAAQIWNVSTDELIINVWKGGDYEWQYTMENVIRHGYKAILSAPWYLNYISYGRDWTKYYEQDPHTFLSYSSGSEVYKDSVLGGQVCMWAEFIDETNLESTLWPRASAPAEKLWSSAQMNDWKRAEARFEHHRCRMFRRGIKAFPNSGPGTCKGSMKIKPPYDAAPSS